MKQNKPKKATLRPIIGNLLKKNVLKAAEEKRHITFKRAKTTLIPYFLAQITKAKR